MNVDELHEFIEDSLERRSEQGSDAEIPRSEEEFRKLWAMLCEKARALMVPYVSRLYEPSEELIRLREKRQRTLAFLAQAPKKSAYKTRTRLRTLELEIAELQARESREHPNRHSAYLRAKPSNDRLSDIISKVRKDIDRAFDPWAAVPIEETYWEYFPPEEYSSEDDVIRHYEGLRRRNPEIKYDQDRIKKAESLGPNKRWSRKAESRIIWFSHLTIRPKRLWSPRS